MVVVLTDFAELAQSPIGKRNDLVQSIRILSTFPPTILSEQTVWSRPSQSQSAGTNARASWKHRTPSQVSWMVGILVAVSGGRGACTILEI
jgi:hypothetical protein